MNFTTDSFSKAELTRPEGSRDRLSFFPVIVLVCYVSVLA